MAEDVEIGWFAGVMDGEGSFLITKSTRPNGSSRLHPQIVVTNSSMKMLDKVMQILRDLDVKFGLCEHNNRPTSEKIVHTNYTCRRVYVTGAVGMKRLLESLMPQLVAKQEQAKLMIEYLAPRVGKSARVRYSERDFEIAVQIKNLNRPHLDTVETTRAPQQ